MKAWLWHNYKCECGWSMQKFKDYTMCCVNPRCPHNLKRFHIPSYELIAVDPKQPWSE